MEIFIKKSQMNKNIVFLSVLQIRQKNFAEFGELSNGDIVRPYSNTGT